MADATDQIEEVLRKTIAEQEGAPKGILVDWIVALQVTLISDGDEVTAYAFIEGANQSHHRSLGLAQFAADHYLRDYRRDSDR